MLLFSFLVSFVFAATNLTITEPVDGETYDGDWLTVKAIVENENELPDSVHYTINGEPVVQIPRLNTDWPTYMQNYLNHGYSESPAPSDNTVFWTAPVCGETHEFCSPTVVNGVVYFLSDEYSAAYAIDASNGDILWSFDVYDNVDDAITYYNDLLYLVADSAWCLNPLDGSKVWSFGEPEGWCFSGSPVVENDFAFVVSTTLSGDSLVLHALDAETGLNIWNYSLPYDFATCLALDNSTIYLAAYTGQLTPGDYVNLVALDAQNGSVLWTNEYTDKGYWDTSPTIDGDYIYIGGSDGYIHAFNTQDGSIVWEEKLHIYSHAWGVEPTAAMHDGNLFIGCSTYGWGYGAVSSYQAGSGALRWEIIDQIELHGSIGLAGDLLYFGEHDGSAIYALDQSTGATVWTYEIPGGLEEGFQSSPSIVDGIMYIAATDGNLYAFGTGMKYTYLDDLFAQVGMNDLIVTSFDEGVEVAADTISFTVTGTGINLEPSRLFNLSATPNPFRSDAMISFEIPEPGFTSVRIFDLAGRSVVSLVNTDITGGIHSVQWNGLSDNGEPVSAGLYLCRIESGGVIETTGLCLLR